MTGLKLWMNDGQSGTLCDVIFDERRWVLGLFIVKPFPAFSACYARISPKEVSSISDSGIHVTLSLDEIEARTDIEKKCACRRT